MSLISGNGRWVYNLNLTTNSRSDGGVNIGAGMWEG
ncbi:YadA-like family protein [Pinirhizobacter sp.]